MYDNNDLWQNYYKETNRENRDKLIIEYSPLIKYCAQRIYQGLPKNIELDELLSYGAFGLIDAINKYKPEINNNFKAYAMLRIRGAIIDGLRKMDWAPQSLRRRAKEIEKAYAILEQTKGRSPTDFEVATYLGIDNKELDKSLQDVGFLSVISLEQPINGDENSLLSLSDLIIDNKSPNPTEEIEKKDIKMLLSSAISELNEKEKIVISLFYFEELTVKEISKILELTEGRISQIHKKAVLKLKSKIIARL